MTTNRTKHYREVIDAAIDGKSMADKSPERRSVEAALESRRKALWLDPDLAAEFEIMQNRLETQFGFRPSPSQTIKYLMTRLPEERTP